MITYRKTAQSRIERAPAAQGPFWAAGTHSPYGVLHDTPLAIDYAQLTATSHARLEVAVAPPLADAFERHEAIREPLLIDASGFAERIYRRGEEAARTCGERGIASILLLSSAGPMPETPLSEMTSVVVSCWPFDEKKLAGLFAVAKESAPLWGAAVPILFPATTRLERLEAIADLAARARASFLAAIPIDLDPTAKHALAELLGQEMDQEEYQTLFHSDLETIGVATERHIAALAAERGMSDAIVLPGLRRSSNWNAAVALALRGTRMIQMKKDIELGWDLLRSARVIADLPKSVETIAQAASLSIVESIHPLAADALTHWIQSGRSEYFDDIDREWRLRRDHFRHSRSS